MTPPFAPGEPVVCVEALNFEHLFTVGAIYFVKCCAFGFAPDGTQEWFAEIIGVNNQPGYLLGYSADSFRPLHGTDIRRLETKYPEYIIKTNEVEG